MPWDYFISHASEDKPLVAAPLAHYLKSGGFNVWYDDFALSVGDSILAGINRGLAESQFGVVILSAAFFTKAWPQRELAGLVATTAGSERRVLPVWHQVSAADVAQASPMLADLKAVSTSMGLNAVAENLVRASFPERLHSLPLSNATSDTLEDRAEGQKLLAGLMEGGTPSREDVLLVLSAYQSLLAALAGYSPLVVPASATKQPLPFDFAIITPHGITGPIELTLVVLGPLTGDDRVLKDVVAQLNTACGPKVGFTDHRLNTDYIARWGRIAGEFPPVAALARELQELVNCDNYNFHLTEQWVFRVLLLYGRRSTDDPDASRRRNELTSSSELAIEVASYDRLLDKRVLQMELHIEA